MHTRRSFISTVIATVIGIGVAVIIVCPALFTLVPWSLAQAETPAADKRKSVSTMKSGPWSKGTTRAHREAAEKLFEEGNKLLIEDSEEAKAAARYRAALEHWQHPAIYFNLSVALRDLDQPIERYRALLRAIEYQVAPLNEPIYAIALRDKKQLEKEVVALEIRCDEPGAQVAINGDKLFVGPGAKTVLIRVGKHNFSATKRSHLPTVKALAITPGLQEPVVLYMFTERDLKIESNPWPTWKPWAVVGAAAAVGAMGAGINLWSERSFAIYDEQVAQFCVPDGCRDGEFRDQRDRAELQRKLAIGAYAAAGTALTVGVALLYANRTRVEEITAEEAERRVSITPVITDKSAGLTARIQF